MAFETREQIEQKFRNRLGFDVQSKRGVDVLNRMDYVTDDDYLNACAKYDLEHADPAFAKARAKAEADYREKLAAAQEKHHAEVMEKAIKDATLDSFDQQQAEDRARARVADALADGEPSSNRGALYTKYLAEEEAKAKRNVANSHAMNQLFREALMQH